MDLNRLLKATDTFGIRYTCVAEGKPCVDKISDNCKQTCINRMFVQSLAD